MWDCKTVEGIDYDHVVVLACLLQKLATVASKNTEAFRYGYTKKVMRQLNKERINFNDIYCFIWVFLEVFFRI